MALHILICLSFLVTSALAHDNNRINTVAYDHTSLIINGSRQLLFSGCIHYPRSPPEMWPDLIKKAKEGGLNVIQTYVFWNLHEPVQGEFDFEGNKDVVKFIKMIGDHGLYAVLRIGPYIEAEWNQGGFPYWLREVPGITFRSNNEPFKHHMKKYAKKIVGLMKKEKLFYPQGGPIILSQIENEYNNVQLAYRENGLKYIQWAANMALNLNTGVPWIMCKQKDAPGEVISTCNGRHCGDTFTGPNGPNKPALWTENWTAQYRVFGDPPSLRTAEDIAYSVARFFSKNGTLTTYYMYHGGTNFGRSSSSFVMTRYYDEAPLDEFGLKREPKFGHLRDLHRALRLSKKALLWGVPRVDVKKEGVEARYFEKPGTDICAAFLTNNSTKDNTTINFRGQEYFLPEKSISILPDCKTVVFNTRTIVAQHSKRSFVPSKKVNNLKWEKFLENIPTMKDLQLKSKDPLELYSLTKDSTDYAWYSTRVNLAQSDLPMRSDVLPYLEIANLGHAMVVFVNGEYAGFEHGSNVKKSFVFKKPIKLKAGENHISLLCMTVGFPNSGAYMEKRFAGPRAVAIHGLSSGTLDITVNNWAHEVGLKGEKLEVFTKEGLNRVKWSPVQGPAPPTVTWYKTHFDAPEGDDPVALNMNSMGKGMAWVNGKSIGRYWVNYLSPLGLPSQAEYHIPRPFLKSEKNLLVVLEETEGNPAGIEVLLVNRDTICSFIGEYHPPSVKSWKKIGGAMQTAVDGVKSGAHLTCPDNKVIKLVEFASFGNPSGKCGNFVLGNCNSPNSKRIVEEQCLGKEECSIPVDRQTFDDMKNDQCTDISKTLAVQVRCAEKD